MPAGLLVNLPRHGAAAIGSYFRSRLVVPFLRRTTPRVPACRGEARPRPASGLWRFRSTSRARGGSSAGTGRPARWGPSADGPHVRELTGAFVDPDPEVHSGEASAGLSSPRPAGTAVVIADGHPPQSA